MTSFTVHIPELLKFFDSDLDARKHSSAVKGVVGEELMLALLIEYFRRVGIAAEVETRVCTTGKQSGYQLDAWVRAAYKNSGEVINYQVEVKCWSAHGVGGGSAYIPNDAPEEYLRAYRKKVWNAYWAGNGFKIAGLNKVLTPMRHPAGSTPILPLACLWAPMHPEGEDAPMFRQPLVELEFPEVLIFSASSFLRSLVNSEPKLLLQLPHFANRMSWFGKLFTFSGEA